MPRAGCRVTNAVQQDRILYNKSVQTRDVGEETDADAAQAEVGLREQIPHERLAEEEGAARGKELDEENVILERYRSPYPR